MTIEKLKENFFRITPDKGMHLTQSELQDDEMRIFCCAAFELNEEDSSKWIEWTEEQKKEYEREHIDKKSEE